MSAPSPIQPGEHTIMEYSSDRCLVMVCTGTVQINNRILPCFQAASHPIPYDEGFALAKCQNESRNTEQDHTLGRHTNDAFYVKLTVPQIMWAKRVLDASDGDLDLLISHLTVGNRVKITWAMKVLEEAFPLTFDPEQSRKLVKLFKEKGKDKMLLEASINPKKAHHVVLDRDARLILDIWTLNGAEDAMQNLVEQCSPLGWDKEYIASALESNLAKIETTLATPVINALRDQAEQERLYEVRKRDWLMQIGADSFHMMWSGCEAQK